MKHLVAKMRSTRRHAMPTYYHVTTPEGLEGIKQRGLVPQVGDRSRALGEENPGVYLFPSRDDRDNALGNWLGDEFEDHDTLHSLEVDLPHDWPLDSSVDYERVSRQPIPFSHVKSVEDV